MVKIQPFGDRVLVRVLKPQEKQLGGLVVAPEARSNRGIVEAVGEGTTLQDGSVKPLSVKEGDEVIFVLGTGIPYSTDNAEYKILNIRDIVGKVIGE